jgi:ATP-dependent Lon protease
MYMSVQGNIKPLRSLTEPLQVAKDNGAKRALIPIENKRNFLDVSADIMEHVDPVFFGVPSARLCAFFGFWRSGHDPEDILVSDKQQCFID